MVLQKQIVSQCNCQKSQKNFFKKTSIHVEKENSNEGVEEETSTEIIKLAGSNWTGYQTQYLEEN